MTISTFTQQGIVINNIEKLQKIESQGGESVSELRDKTVPPHGDGLVEKYLDIFTYILDNKQVFLTDYSAKACERCQKYRLSCKLGLTMIESRDRAMGE